MEALGPLLGGAAALLAALYSMFRNIKKDRLAIQEKQRQQELRIVTLEARVEHLEEENTVLRRQLEVERGRRR